MLKQLGKTKPFGALKKSKMEKCRVFRSKRHSLALKTLRVCEARSSSSLDGTASVLNKFSIGYGGLIFSKQRVVS